MPQSPYTLEDVLPHRAPMILIDGIESVDLGEKTLVAYVTAKPEWRQSQVAIEFMAQASAALAGYADRMQHPDRPARPGFLLGTRKLTLRIPEFAVGRRYRIFVRNEFGDEEAGSFACAIEDEAGNVVADAILNAYRPLDIEDFMKGLNR